MFGGRVIFSVLRAVLLFGEPYRSWIPARDFTADVTTLKAALSIGILNQDPELVSRGPRLLRRSPVCPKEQAVNHARRIGRGRSIPARRARGQGGLAVLVRRRAVGCPAAIGLSIRSCT